MSEKKTEFKRIPAQIYLSYKLKAEIVKRCIILENERKEFYSEAKFHREAAEHYIKFIDEKMKKKA